MTLVVVEIGKEIDKFPCFKAPDNKSSEPLISLVTREMQVKSNFTPAKKQPQEKQRLEPSLYEIGKYFGKL